MTPQELRSKKYDLILAYKDQAIEWAVRSDPNPSTGELLDQLDALDKEYAATKKNHNAFYALLTALDRDYSVLKSAQGNPARLRAAMDAIRGDLQAYEESEGL